MASSASAKFIHVCQVCSVSKPLNMLTDFKNTTISSDPDKFQKCFNTSETFKIYFKEHQLYGSFRHCEHSGLFITVTV